MTDYILCIAQHDEINDQLNKKRHSL